MGTAHVKSILALAEFVRSDARTPPIGPQQLQFTATLHCDPDRLLLRTVHDAQHGSAHFTGQALLDGEPVQADLTTRIEIREGDGPLQGFFKLTWPGRHTLSARFLGHARTGSITAALSVIGGQGPYANASGEGSVVGYHAGPIGQPITFDIRIQLS